MNKSSELLLNALTVYYQKHPQYLHLLDKIIEGEYEVSLRVMDWFITHYAKYNNILYWIDEKNNGYHEKIQEMQPHYRKFHLYMDYRSQLKSYTKLYFDPFRRHERITFVIQQKPLKTIETTIGQLNFFRWVFQNHILTYLKKYQKTIESAMNQEQIQKKKDNVKTVRSHGKIIHNAVMQSQCFLKFD